MSSKCEIACLISVNTLTLLVSNTLTLTDGKNLVVQQDAFAIAQKSTEQKKERLLYEDRYILIFAATLSLLKRL